MALGMSSPKMLPMTTIQSACLLLVWRLGSKFDSLLNAKPIQLPLTLLINGTAVKTSGLTRTH